MGDLRFIKDNASYAKRLHNQCFKFINSIDLYIFKLKFVNERWELFLQYNYFAIGKPERDDFKLCDIYLNKPVEIKINGKIDFSASRGRERIYKEQYYVFEYLGAFRRCNIVMPFEYIRKKVPANSITIDLMKKLW